MDVIGEPGAGRGLQGGDPRGWRPEERHRLGVTPSARGRSDAHVRSAIPRDVPPVDRAHAMHGGLILSLRCVITHEAVV